MDAGFQEHFIMPALYSFARDGIVMVLLASHVDDIIWAADPEADEGIMAIQTELIFGKLEDSSFRFCGIEIEQAEDFTIKVTCAQTCLHR